MLETDYRNGHASGGLTSTGLLMEGLGALLPRNIDFGPGQGF